MHILRHGPSWAPPEGFSEASVEYLVRLFHTTARVHDSQAIWCIHGGLLVTVDAAEPARSLPYESWRDEALVQAQSARG